MYILFRNIFYLTLFLYIMTLIFASYVGVYLTYFAIPVIVISGVIAYFLEPKDLDHQTELTDEQRIKQIEDRLEELKRRK